MMLLFLYIPSALLSSILTGIGVVVLLTCVFLLSDTEPISGLRSHDWCGLVPIYDGVVVSLVCFVSALYDLDVSPCLMDGVWKSRCLSHLVLISFSCWSLSFGCHLCPAAVFLVSGVELLRPASCPVSRFLPWVWWQVSDMYLTLWTLFDFCFGSTPSTAQRLYLLPLLLGMGGLLF